MQDPVIKKKVAAPHFPGSANNQETGSGNTEKTSEHIRPVPRRRPVIDADEDTRRRRLAGARSADGRRRSPIIDADHSFSTPCRSCGAPTASSDGICLDCADAQREERAAALEGRCRIHRVRYVEDLPVHVLEEMQRGRC